MKEFTNEPDWVREPPKEALTPIKGGRIKGASNINPQWRIDTMNRRYGPYGYGWKIQVVNSWVESVEHSKERMAHVLINVFIKNEAGEWSEGAPGFGGNMLVEQEKGGLHTSDEGYKMAFTDALGTALRLFEVGGHIYRGFNDNKYGKEPLNQQKGNTTPPAAQHPNASYTGNVGLLEKVSVKTGNKKDGSSWVKYGCKIDGKWYGTFDTNLGQLAQSLEGQNVNYTATSDGQYMTLEAISLYQDYSMPPAPEDDLAF